MKASVPQSILDVANDIRANRTDELDALTSDRYRNENTTAGFALMARATSDLAWRDQGLTYALACIDDDPDWMTVNDTVDDLKGILGWRDYGYNQTVADFARAVFFFNLAKAPFGSKPSFREWVKTQHLITPVTTTEGNWRGHQSMAGQVALWLDPLLAADIWTAWLAWRTTPGAGITWLGPSSDHSSGSNPDSWHSNRQARFAVERGMAAGEWSSWAARVLTIFATNDAHGTPQGYEYLDGTNEAHPFNSQLFEGFARIGQRSQAVWNKGKAILDRLVTGPGGTTVYDIHHDADRMLLLCGSLAVAYAYKNW